MSVLTRLDVPGSADQWRTLGFELDGDGFQVTHVAFILESPGLAWSFDELHADEAELGVPTGRAPTPSEPPAHPNGIDAIDHVVYAVPDLDRTIEVFRSVLGLEPRRRARPRGPRGPEMAFYRAGEAVIEVVASGRGPAFGGVAFRCSDLDATVAAIKERGGPVGDPKPAVQGGRIASVWRGHVGMPIAVLEPPERS